jgi:hypothetical protein
MTSGRLELATAKQPSLLPSIPTPPAIASLTYQAPCTTIARASGLLLVNDTPDQRAGGLFERKIEHRSSRCGERVCMGFMRTVYDGTGA